MSCVNGTYGFKISIRLCLDIACVWPKYLSVHYILNWFLSTLCYKNLRL